MADSIYSNQDQEPYLHRRQRERTEESRDQHKARLPSVFAIVLAQAALHGASAALRYGKEPLIRALGDLERAIGKSPRLKKYLPPIYEGAHEYFRRPMDRAQAKEALKYRHLESAGDLETLYGVVKAGSPFAGVKDKVLGSAMEHMTRYAPRQHGAVSHVTLHDIIYGPTNPMLQKALGQDAAAAREYYQLIMKSPVGQAYLAQVATNPQALAKRIMASPSLYTGGGELYDIARFRPKNVLSWLAQFRFPFTGWKPFELLFPTEMTYGQPGVKMLEGEFTRKMLEQITGEPHKRALFVGGKLFPVAEKTLLEPLAGPFGEMEFRLGRARSGMFRGARARLGIPPGMGAAENWLERQKIISSTLKDEISKARMEGTPLSASEIIKKADDPTWVQRLQIRAAAIGERWGIGPQFATRGSRVSGFFQRLMDIVKHPPVVTGEFVEGGLKQVPGVTPEGAYLSTKLGKFGKWAGLRVGAEAPKSINELSSVERFLLRLGIEPKRAVTRITPRGTTVVERLPVARFAPEGASAVTRGMGRDFGEYYAYPKAFQTKGSVFGGFGDWLNYQMIRPYWLMEEMTGLGFVPGQSWTSTIGRTLTRTVLPVAAAASVVNYLDYRMERRGLPGPVRGLATGYTKIRLAEQRILDSLGITDKAKEIEDKFPGIIDSPLSKALRFGLSSIGGAWLGAAGGGLPAMFAGVGFGMLNLTDVTQSYNELREIYSGERNIPVRRGRWWFLGRDKWEGKKTNYFRKSWYPLLMSRYKDIALYGSEADAWGHGSYLPTPENAFLLKRIFDPYALERRQFFDRPYPLTAGFGEDIPLIGPWASRSRLLPFRYIKPQYRMHKEYWSDTGSISEEVRPTGPEEAGWQLGYGYWPRFQRRSVMRSRLDQMVGEEIYRLTQWTGLTGFMAGWLKNQVTGSENWFDKRPQIATAGSMASVQRDYYDREISGGLGHTEFLRRYIPRGRRYIEQFNPIPNTMPNWLPGSRSKFERDRNAYEDTHTGDAFTKWQFGEARLPGPGYEQLEKLHSGIPGYYDAMDRFLILSDLFPHSDAFRQYKAIVESWQKSGRLDPYWNRKYQEALYQIDERERPPFEERRYAPGSLQDQTVTVQQLTGPTKFKATDGREFSLAGVEHNMDRQIWRAESQGKDIRRLAHGYQMVQGKLDELVGRTINIRAGSQGLESDAPAVIAGINEYAIKLGLGGEIRNAADAQARYGQSAAVRMWDSLRHARIPGPMGWPVTKFFGRRSAVEDYQLSELEGGDFAGWDHPYRNFIRFYGRQAINSVLPTPRIPGDVRERRDLEEYFDKMKYLKYRGLEIEASARGQQQAAGTYRGMWRKTMVGLQEDDSNFFRRVWGAIPKTERRYFKSFAQESDPKYRGKILEMVPDYMKPIYLGIWNRDHAYPSDHVGMTPGPAMANVNSQMVVERQVQTFFKQFRMPDADWVGWDPRIDLERIRVKTVADTAQDFHDYQIWESQVREVDDMSIPPAPFTRALAVGANRTIVDPSVSKRRRRAIEDLLRQSRGSYSVKPNSMGYNRMDLAQRPSMSPGFEDRVRSNVVYASASGF